MVDGIPCPKCHKTKLYTVDTRPSPGAVRRWRQCAACLHRFMTLETIGGPNLTNLTKVQVATRPTEFALRFLKLTKHQRKLVRYLVAELLGEHADE